jgi:UDP-GlcNAc:undecaprenyl-phosphate GlcNAc-1-phosphate transferase
MIAATLLAAASSFALTWLLVPAVRALARRVGLLDRPGPRKIHSEPMPYGGGLAVAAGLLVPALAFTAAYLDAFPKPAVVYAIGSLVILALGLSDDRRPLRPGFKLAIEAIVALGVTIGGERLQLFGIHPILEGGATVLWILVMTNALNLLDHMDGLASGVAAVAGLSFILIVGDAWVDLWMGCLVGACLGFLVHNFPPARIFLGDAGSLFIGYWLACLLVSSTFYESYRPKVTYLAPFVVLFVPLFDTARVVWIRLRLRAPLFRGDTNHVAHRLTALGLSRRSAVLAVYALTAYTGASAALLYQVPADATALVFVQLLLTFGLIVLLERPTRHG